MERLITIILFSIAIVVVTGTQDSSESFQVKVDSTGQYSVLIKGQLWLRSAPTFITVNHKSFTIKDGSLKLIKMSSNETGWDSLGHYKVTSLDYSASGTKVTVRVSFKWYKELPLVLLGQHYLTPVDGSSAVGAQSAVSSGFPSFYMDSAAQAGRETELGFLAYGGIMTGDSSKKVGLWNNQSRMISGLDAGPLVLFDKSQNAVLVSPFDNFMAVSVQYRRQGGNRTASWGVLGSANQIPNNFECWTAIMYSGQGVNKLIEDFGWTMRWYYKKERSFTDSDLVNNYIGYWTDNGAYYYYLTEGSMNYEDTILAVKSYADKEKIPYRYVQYDSWFYPKGPRNGVTEWDSMMHIFPSGLKSMWTKTGWPVLAHNRWWSNATVYATQNGGKYEFAVEDATSKALPLDQQFWDDLMRESKEWGLITYEQDWLNVQFDMMHYPLTHLSAGRQWLHQMAKGAARNGITIQYCMSPPRHALTSLELPVVTQIRVSEDYQPGEDNWKIGISSMLAHALGLAPFKDNFWTTTTQPGNIYKKSETHPALHALAATLSTGPVGPSDKVGYSNVSLIMRSCNADGLILKPSRPAMAISKQLILRAYSGFTGEIWSTFSYISGLQFGILLGADFPAQTKVTVGPSEAGLDTKYLVPGIYQSTNPAAVSEFSDTKPITLSGCSKTDFCLYYTSPVLKYGNHEVLILGELSKWVPVSPKRVSSITISTTDIQISLTGAVNENVTFSFLVDGTIKDIDCTLKSTGTAILSLVKSDCFLL